MIYPDEEKITYSYNVGDHLESLELKPIEYDNVLNFALWKKKLL